MNFGPSLWYAQTYHGGPGCWWLKWWTGKRWIHLCYIGKVKVRPEGQPFTRPVGARPKP